MGRIRDRILEGAFIMLDQIILLETFIIIGLTSLFVFVGMFIKRDKDYLQKLLIVMSVFTVGTMIGNTLVPKIFSHVWLFSYLVFGIMLLILRGNKITPLFMLVTSIASTLVIFMIPFENLKFPEEGFISLKLVLVVVNVIIYTVLYRTLKRGNDKFNSNIINLLALGLTTSYFEFEIYHLTLMVVFFTILLWHTVTRVLEENNRKFIRLEDKLHRLDKEFQYEVRKEVNKHTFHLKEVQEKMSHINKIDNLTQSFNKKAILDMIEGYTSDRRIESFSIIMFDLDNFKTLNDTLGHVQGDLCLKSLSALAKECIRASDSLGRYGGDEFIIVLPKANLSTALTIAERFRTLVDKKTQPHYTVSVGLATYPDDGHSLLEILDIADKGLYLSKEKGRNAVSYHNPKLEKKY